MTIDNDNNLENRNEIISEKVEGDNNIIQQKQDGQWISIKVREEEPIKALKLEDEKGYINKNVDDDSNDQGQVKRVLFISRKNPIGRTLHMQQLLLRRNKV